MDHLRFIRDKILEVCGELGLIRLLQQLRRSEQDCVSEINRFLSTQGVVLPNSVDRKLVNTTLEAALKEIRGSMTNGRLKLVENAWNSVKSKNDVLSKDALISSFDSTRHPDVQKGVLSAKECATEFEAFVEPLQEVTKDDFVDIYHVIGSSVTDDAFFKAVLVRSWRLDQPHNYGATKEELRKHVTAEFQTSSYRGNNGVVPPLEVEEPVQVKENLRFAAMISNSLEPFPLPKPGMLPKGVGSASYVSTNTINHKARTFRGGNEVTGNMDLSGCGNSTTGRVPNGLRDSVGFLDTVSTLKGEVGTGKYSDNVLQVLEAGRRREAELAAEREKIKAAEFVSREPKGYVKSTSEHSNMQGVDPSSYRSEFKSRNAKERSGQDNRRAIADRMGKEYSVVEEELAETLNKEKEKSIPRGYKPHNNSSWESTSHNAFAMYNVTEAVQMNERHAVRPALHKNQVLLPEEQELCSKSDERHQRRHEGDYSTTEASTFVDKSKEVEVVTKFHARGAFNLKGGVATINGAVHKPRDVQTGESFGPSQTVPGQYLPMSKRVTMTKS